MGSVQADRDQSPTKMPRTDRQILPTRGINERQGVSSKDEDHLTREVEHKARRRCSARGCPEKAEARLTLCRRHGTIRKLKYLARKQTGLCTYGGCHKSQELGHVYCQKHLQRLRESARTRSNVRMLDGICVSCGKRPQFWGTRCIICRQTYATHPLPFGARRALRVYREDENRRRSEETQRDAQTAALKLISSQEIDGKRAEALRLHLGLIDGKKRSLKQVGEKMGLSRERARQLLLPAKTALGEMLSEQRPSHEFECNTTNLNASYKDPECRLRVHFCAERQNVDLINSDDHAYPYKNCGLTSVLLFGVSFNECVFCGRKVATIPRTAELHNALAKAILLKPALLVGEEFRFLRTQTKLSAAALSQKLGVTSVAVLSWERSGLLRYPNDLAGRITFAGMLWPREEQLVAQIIGTIRPRPFKSFQLKACWINEEIGWSIRV